MFNINDTLNNVIAVVVVILILSMVVQSVQSMLKKLFKIKSRQIEESLVDLFSNLLGKLPTQPSGWLDKLIDHAPIWRIVFGRPADTNHDQQVKDIYQDVIKGFAEVGRLAQSGNQMLDSIAKDDLLKVMQKLPVTRFVPDLAAHVSTAFRQIKGLETAIADFKGTVASGAARDAFAAFSADYASIEAKLKPLFNDVQSIIDEGKLSDLGSPPVGSPPTSPSESAANLLVRDIAALRDIDIDAVLKALSDLQSKVAAAIPSASPTGAGAVLTTLVTGLGDIANAITSIRQNLDAVIAPFKAKLKEVQEWYDIVMQSFEERYNRSMKSWAVVIAFLVVVVLNANFFNIYRTIASSDVVKNLLVQKGPEILKLSQQESTPPQQTTQGQTTPAPITQKELDDSVQKLKSDANLYLGIGFAPLSIKHVKDWLSGWLLDSKSEKPWTDWLHRRTHDLWVLLGWIIMTMLLSIGAPFWQDTLESLFGVKNLLRKKGDIKNVESESGAGQPKP